MILEHLPHWHSLTDDDTTNVILSKSLNNPLKTWGCVSNRKRKHGDCEKQTRTYVLYVHMCYYSVHTDATHHWLYGNEIRVSVLCLTNRDPQWALPNKQADIMACIQRFSQAWRGICRSPIAGGWPPSVTLMRRCRASRNPSTQN